MQFRCPRCETTVIVPAALINHVVECEACQLQFRADPNGPVALARQPVTVKAKPVVKRRSSYGRRLTLAACFALLSCGLVVAIASRVSPPGGYRDTGSSTAREKDGIRFVDRAPLIGEQGILVIRDKPTTDVAVFIDEQAADEAILRAAAKDDIGWTKLVASERLLICKPGTRALAIDPGFVLTKVRLLNGEYQDKEVLVRAEHVRAIQE